MGNQTIGLLVMAYGTPRTLDEVEPYYTHIRHGRPPSAEQLAELRNRYAAIGGTSPLNEITTAQVEALEKALNVDNDVSFSVYLGLKHVSPFINDAIQQMYDDGIQHAITLVLAPHYSTMSVGSYQKTADDAVARLGGPTLLHIDNWHLHPKFLSALTERVKDGLTKFSDPASIMTLFSAHSLPARILTMGDPYENQLHETGDAVARQLSLSKYGFAWQSAGRTADEWLGPDILQVLPDLRTQGHENVLICPAGFVSDHLEVIYDIDIEAQKLAAEIGLNLVRTRSFNADADFISALTEVVRQRYDHWKEKES